MNSVRKANVVLMYLRRNGYTETAEALWIIFAYANQNAKDKQVLIDWLNNDGSLDSLINKILFLYDGGTLIRIKLGLKAIHKLLAVLPQDKI